MFLLFLQLKLTSIIKNTYTSTKANSRSKASLLNFKILKHLIFVEVNIFEINIFILYYINELIPSSKKFCSIYFPHQ